MKPFWNSLVKSLRLVISGLFLSTISSMVVSISFADEKTIPEVNAAKQKAVLVTGATSGIGKNIAMTLADKGYFVYAGARKQKDIDALNAINNVQAVKLDVTKQSDIDAAVEFIQTQERGLYGLVNNAGVGVFAPLIEISEEDMQFQMDVNLFGPYRVTKAFAPMIIESKGRISTIGSISGANASRFFGAYSMSKFAVEAFTESLAQEMAKFGVGVSVVEPGNYNSKIAASALKRMEKNAKKNFKSLYQQEFQGLSKYLTGDRSRFKEPDDVSAAVMDALFSETPKTRYMVVPVASEGEWALRGMIKRMVQMNHAHQFSLSRDQLIEILDQELGKLQPNSKAPAQ
ncbi:SDR family oxidoreductase [Kangiella sp. TOML190]|uniref:SDR family oxidoreductase n=1 Tax=Kangiella sp. TOML190 TaxID=2931351 RepID=UPI00203D286D|nr:SDR family oxidoreductase [Kangiella sp. TOML190]